MTHMTATQTNNYRAVKEVQGSSFIPELPQQLLFTSRLVKLEGARGAHWSNIHAPCIQPSTSPRLQVLRHREEGAMGVYCDPFAINSL